MINYNNLIVEFRLTCEMNGRKHERVILTHQFLFDNLLNVQTNLILTILNKLFLLLRKLLFGLICERLVVYGKVTIPSELSESTQILNNSSRF